MKEKEAEVLENYLREKNLKITGQRKLILDAFLNNEEHISAEELYDRLKTIPASASPPFTGPSNYWVNAALPMRFILVKALPDTNTYSGTNTTTI